MSLIIVPIFCKIAGSFARWVQSLPFPLFPLEHLVWGEQINPGPCVEHMRERSLLISALCYVNADYVCGKTKMIAIQALSCLLAESWKLKA